MPQINDTIQDFTLEAFHNERTKKIKLSDYRGKWLVLLFYPADFTFVCPTELEDAAQHYEYAGCAFDFVNIGLRELHSVDNRDK